MSLLLLLLHYTLPPISHSSRYALCPKEGSKSFIFQLRPSVFPFLFQRFFGQHDVIDPDGPFAVDDEVQGYPVRLLTFLEKESVKLGMPGKS